MRVSSQSGRSSGGDRLARLGHHDGRGAVPVDHRAQPVGVAPGGAVAGGAIRIHPVEVHAPGEEVAQGGEVVGGEAVFGAVAAQGVEILAGLGLRPAGGEQALERHRMGAVQDHQPVHPLRRAHRQRIGHRGTPVVTDDRRRVAAAEAVDHRQRVGDHVPGLVMLRAARAPRLAVAALIGRDAEVAVGEARQQLFPGAGIFRETVQEEEERPPGLARGQGEERVTVDLEPRFARPHQAVFISGRTWPSNCWRSVSFETLPVAVSGSASTKTTSSGSCHLAKCPDSSVEQLLRLQAVFGGHDDQQRPLVPFRMRHRDDGAIGDLGMAT